MATFLTSILRILEDTSTETKSSSCEMFGTFSVLIQLLLGVLAFSILIIKRFVEKPRRPWKIWWFDASKQIVSACVIHLLNLILSAIFASSESSDQCVWYFLSVFMDCTLGVFLSYILMWLIDGIAKAANWKLLESGLYFEQYTKNNKVRYRLKPKMYFAQLGIWLIVTIIAKILIIIIIKICRRFLENIGVFILSPFNNGKLRLVFVMVVFPLILNAIYFWIVDSILKFSPNESDKDIKELYEHADEPAAQTNPTIPNQNNEDNANEPEHSPPGDKKEEDSLTNNERNNYNQNQTKGDNRETKAPINYSIELPDLDDNNKV